MANTSEELAASDNLNALLQSMVEGMIVQDQTGRIIQFNQAALEILGMAQDQLNESEDKDSNEADPSAVMSESEWDKIFPGKDHLGMNCLKTGEIQRNLVMRVFRYDGEVRWISLNAVPIVNNRTGTPYQVICTFTDITEMKRVLNDLKQVQLLFNISQDLMIIANSEGYFKRINPRFTEVLGHQMQEIVSQKFINLVHPEDVESTSIELQKVSDQKSIHFINRYQTKNKDYRVFDWVVVKDKETNLVYFTARDITDYRAEELDIIHSSKFYSLGEITSGLAYMVNGQLSIIGSHVAFLNKQIENDNINPLDLKNKIQCIEESVQRLGKMTKDLSLFARNTEDEEIADVPLKHLIDNVVSLCKERFRIHGVKLDIALEENLYIHGRENQLAHVLLSLLNNSYNSVHGQRDSWVKLTASLQKELVVIDISDSGEKKSEANIHILKGIVEENFGTIYFAHSSPHVKFVIEFPETKQKRP